MFHALVLSVLLALSSFTQTPTVSFSNVNDAVPGRFFSAAASVADPVAGNVLRVGVDSGFDSGIWKYRDFRATNLAYYYPAASDTLAFTATAPAGYVIASVRYEENLTAGASRTGKATTFTQVVVNGRAATGLNVSTPDFPRTVVVSITTSLFAGTSDASVGAGRVVVELLSQ